MSPGLRGDEVEAEVDRSSAYARWIFLMLRRSSDEESKAFPLIKPDGFFKDAILLLGLKREGG